MKPKEALIKDGKVPTTLGRGRMSAAQKERCRELVAQGWQIDGFSLETSKSTDKPAVVKAEPVTNEKVIAELVYRYDETEWQAKAEDGTIFGMREVCQPCGYSLVGHGCDEPIVLGKAVKVVPVKPSV